MRILRSLLALLAGLLVITLIVEPLEFALVAALNGGVTTDPEIYFGVRNRPGMLAAKLVYNTIAAVVGGFVAAWLARRAPVAHGVVLAWIQTAAFLWAFANPEMRRWTPDWMWLALMVLTAAGIVAGAWMQRRRALRRVVSHVVT